MDPNISASTSSSESHEILRKQIGDLQLSLRLSQKQSGTLLQRQLYGLQQFIDHAVLGLYRTTIHGQFVMANAALAQIFGYDSPEAMMEDVTDIGTQLYVQPAERTAWCQCFHNQDRVGPVLWRGHRTNHELLWLEEYARVIRDTQGHILGYEGMVLDVTTRYS